MINYKTSKDYTHLKDLCDNGKEVICFVTWDFNRGMGEKMPTTDICTLKVLSPNSPKYKHYSFLVRGHEFGDYWPSIDDRFTFEELCEHLKVEYIEPNE